MKKAIIVHWSQWCFFNKFLTLKYFPYVRSVHLILNFHLFQLLLRDCRDTFKPVKEKKTCRVSANRGQSKRQRCSNSEHANTPTYSWSNVSRLGSTFRLLHVAQHSGSSFIQHVLQKHHLTTTGFHPPHQAEGHVPTPETQENLVYVSIKRISAKLAFLTTCLPRSVPTCVEAGKAAQNGSTDFCPSLKKRQGNKNVIQTRTIDNWNQQLPCRCLTSVYSPHKSSHQNGISPSCRWLRQNLWNGKSRLTLHHSWDGWAWEGTDLVM